MILHEQIQFNNSTYRTDFDFSLSGEVWFFFPETGRYIRVDEWQKGEFPPKPKVYLETPYAPESAFVITGTLVKKAEVV